MTHRAVSRGTILCIASLFGASMAAAAPQASHHAVVATGLQAQAKAGDAKIAAARAQNAALQSKVAQMEQQGATQKQQLQQRDAEIAALQQKLRAAGVPASAVSAGH